MFLSPEISQGDEELYDQQQNATTNFPGQPYEITETFERGALFPEWRPKGALPIDVSFGFEPGADRPSKITVLSDEYPVECDIEKHPASEFFRRKVVYDDVGVISELSFANPSAQTYFNTVCRIYESVQFAALTEATRDEFALAYFPSPGKKQNFLEKHIDRLRQSKIVNEAWDDRYWHSDIKQRVLTWIESLELQEVSVISHTTKVQVKGKPLTITRVLLGDISMTAEDSFFMEEMTAQALFFSSRVLRTGLRRDIEIFDTSVFDTKDGSAYTDPMSAETGKRGKRKNNTLLINSKALPEIVSIDHTQYNEINVQSKKILAIGLQRAVIQHECAHFIDPCYEVSTVAQSEGFAKAFENGFSFRRVIKQMGKNNSEVVGDKVKLIFSNQVPETILPREKYYLTGAFDAWLYQKLGPRYFMRFHLLITGKEDTGRGVGLHKFVDSVKQLPAKNKHRNNLVACLNELAESPDWHWKDADELLEEFCSDFNKSIQ